MTGGQSDGKGNHNTCYGEPAHSGTDRQLQKAQGGRVSTDHEEQQGSYEAQVDYYTNYIKGRDDWEFVSVYTDASDIIGLNQKEPNSKGDAEFSPVLILS